MHGSNGIDGEIGLVGTGRTGPARQGSGAWCGANLDELGRWNRLPLQCCLLSNVPLKVLEPSFTSEEEKKKKKRSSPFTVWSRVAPGFWSHAAACSLELEYTFGASGWLFVVPRSFYKKDGLGLGLGRAQTSPAQPSPAHTRSARISSPSFPDDGGGGRSSRGA